MCGIVGLIQPDPSRERIRRASEQLFHRGPDDLGIFIDDHAALAARRLSIIDLEGGRQPLSNEDGTVWITYNGEIFNSPTLREELLDLGHKFRTHTDTEVIVHAYEEWGPDAVARFRGMFAFGIWDVRRKRLFLARDRFGIKPLYYIEQPDAFAFASEIQPLFAAVPNLTREPNRTALRHLFERGYVPAPMTPFAGVRQLPAAHMLVYENKQVNIRSYWSLSFPLNGEHETISAEDAETAFLARLREAVDAWRLSDVPVGSLLSGGIDSASLAALLTEVSGDSIHTFTIRFSEASHNESEQAKATAKHIGSTHHELDFSMSDFDALPGVVRRLESPQCSATSIPISLLYKACREAGFKVIMTGEGADELLGGYHWFDGDRRARSLLRLPGWGRRLLAGSPLPMSEPARRVLLEGNGDPVHRYRLWTQVGPPAERDSLLKIPGQQKLASPFLDSDFPLRDRHPLDQFLYLDSHTRMVDFINFEVDRMSMMHSVEARPPFLDHELWEWAAKMPPGMKLSGAGNKLLLRRAMGKYLPPAALARPKKGLATPHAAWWRSKKLPAWAEDCVDQAALRATGYFEAEAFNRLRESHQAGRADNSRLLTGVLTTQIWHQEMGVQ